MFEPDSKSPKSPSPPKIVLSVLSVTTWGFSKKVGYVGFTGLLPLIYAMLQSKKRPKCEVLTASRIDGFIDGNKNKTPRRAHVY